MKTNGDNEKILIHFNDGLWFENRNSREFSTSLGTTYPQSEMQYIRE